MPVTREPQTNTIGYTIDVAIADAWRFVAEYPVVNSTDQCRVAYHAISNYFRELGVRRDDIEKITQLLVDAELSEFGRGWAKGWDAGFAHGRENSAPPF